MKPKSRLAALMGTVLALGLSLARADETGHCYTVASLQGTYGVVATYGANVALALAVRHFDGQGNMTGTFTLNAPVPDSPTGARQIITGKQVGTYTVNCDGTGIIDRTVTASNGVVSHQLDDFVITQAKRSEDMGLLATALQDATRVPSAILPNTGLFIIRSYTRRPD